MYANMGPRIYTKQENPVPIHLLQTCSASPDTTQTHVPKPGASTQAVTPGTQLASSPVPSQHRNASHLRWAGLGWARRFSMWGKTSVLSPGRKTKINEAREYRAAGQHQPWLLGLLCASSKQPGSQVPGRPGPVGLVQCASATARWGRARPRCQPPQSPNETRQQDLPRELLGSPPSTQG